MDGVNSTSEAASGRSPEREQAFLEMFHTVGSMVRSAAIALESWCDAVERHHRDQLKKHALALRQHWRKADVPRLLRLGIGGEPADGRYMAMLLEGGGPRGGRAVVPMPTTVAEEILDWVRLGQTLVALAAPPHIRRAVYQKTRWWPHLIEAAYRESSARLGPRCVG